MRFQKDGVDILSLFLLLTTPPNSRYYMSNKPMKTK